MSRSKIQKIVTISILTLLLTSTILSIAKPVEDQSFNLSENRSFLPKTNILIKNSEPNQINKPIEILYPRFSCPAILQAGDSLDIIINTNEFNQVYAYIETAHEPIIDTFWLPIINVEKNSTTTITTSIPETCPIEMYNLTIYIEKSDQYYSHQQPHSISIRNDISGNYSFIQIADLHVGDIRGLFENPSQTIGWKAVKQCIREVNILSPDFVVITGDLVFGQFSPLEYTYEYTLVYDILQQFDVPIYLVPGNHDGYNRILEDGLEFWTRYFGPHYYSFNYGTSHFQVLNSFDHSKFERLTFLFLPLNWGGSITQPQIEWIQQDLDNSQNSELQFMLLHHNPLWETNSESLTKKAYENRETLLQIIQEKSIDAVLAGHVHYDNITMLNDTLFITTTTPQSSMSKPDAYWGYRHIFIENETISSYNYEEPKYSNPTYKLETKIIDLYTKEVHNDLEIPIQAQIKFLLPNGTYSAQNGNIHYERQNEIFTELYVYTDVDPLSSSKVIITELTN